MTTGAREDDALTRAARLAFAAPEEAGDDDGEGELALRTFGDYELVEVLGAGGMGVVYRARHRLLERDVALKIIAEDARNDDSGALFLDEARNAARLNHPNIVPVYDVGTHGGLHFFSMQLVDGEHLGRRIARRALSEREAIALLLPVCDALDYAHRLGVLHLDLKPANILVDSRGAPLVADFGLARRVGADGTARARDVSGTPAYMAPEQLQAESGRLTVATDVYSLGAVLYEMLAGVSPHGRGDAAELAARALAGKIAPVGRHRPGVSRDLEAVCRHCLAHEPRQRYASVAALADDLRRIRDGLPVSVRRPGRGERLLAWMRREPRFAGALAAALFATVLGAIASAALWRHAESERERAALSAEIGASLFVLADGEYENRSSRQLTQRLQERLPGDAARQAAVLADYVAALDGRSAGIRRFGLRAAVIEAFGNDYRRAVIAKLREAGDAHSLLFAAQLAWMLQEDTGSDEDVARALVAAVAAAPASKEALFVAATYCPRGDDALPTRCAVADAAQRLVEVDADNGFAWMLLATQVAPAKAAAMVHEAAARERIDDYYSALRLEFADAIVATGVPLPPQLAVAFALPGEDAAVVFADDQVWMSPDTFSHRIGWICDPARNPALDAALRADCRALALRLNAARGSIGTTMLGSSIIRRLEPGSPLAAQMVAQRRTMIYRRETLARTRRNESAGVRLRAQWFRDYAGHSELDLLGKALVERGRPADPPPDWQPNDPRMMELPENRPKPR